LPLAGIPFLQLFCNLRRVPGIIAHSCLEIEKGIYILKVCSKNNSSLFLSLLLHKCVQTKFYVFGSTVPVLRKRSTWVQNVKCQNPGPRESYENPHLRFVEIQVSVLIWQIPESSIWSHTTVLGQTYKSTTLIIFAVLGGVIKLDISSETTLNGSFCAKLTKN